MHISYLYYIKFWGLSQINQTNYGGLSCVSVFVYELFKIVM